MRTVSPLPFALPDPSPLKSKAPPNLPLVQVGTLALEQVVLETFPLFPFPEISKTRPQGLV